MRFAAVCSVAMLAVACGDDATVSPDASQTADAGVGQDALARMDAQISTDAAPGDAAMGPDAAETDLGTATDGGFGDTGVGGDVGVLDSSAGDASSADAGVPWGHCPSSADYVGDQGWQNEITANQDAVYCGTFNEARTLAEELQAKTMLRVVPGTYPVPTDMTSHAFFLPVCLDRNNAMPPTPETPGTIDHSVNMFNGTEYHQNAVRMFFDDQGTRRLSIARFYMDGPAGTPVSLSLDGSTFDAFGGAGFDISFCGGEIENDCFGLESVRFDSCTHASSDLHRHNVDFTGGTVELDLRIGVSAASTEPGAFVRASGTFQGTSFQQLDYWKLVYNPDHHHFARDFAVFFDAPISGACGLEITRLEPFAADTENDHVYTIDCSLNRISELTVTNATWMNLGP